MIARVFIVVLFACVCSVVFSEPSMGPVIDDYGPTYPIDDRDVALPDGFDYKMVFDVAKYSADSTELNSTLVSAARYLNMHARNGVDPERMHLALVVHGKAVKNLLVHSAYQRRFKSQNPNLDLLEKLHEAGVQIFVCGQSLTFGGIAKDELVPQAKVALSAMTMLTVLQADGYAVLF